MNHVLIKKMYQKFQFFQSFIETMGPLGGRLRNNRAKQTQHSPGGVVVLKLHLFMCR